jgi:hypothetical protein
MIRDFASLIIPFHSYMDSNQWKTWSALGWLEAYVGGWRSPDSNLVGRRRPEIQ